MKDKPEILTEWLISDDIELLSYNLSGLLVSANFQIIKSHTTQWSGEETIVWILDDGIAFLRSYNNFEKLFFELSSFNHDKHLSFVIKLKNLLLQNTKGLFK